MTQRPELTATGRRWAIANESRSMVARVALTGRANGWPDEHTSLAIRIANNGGTYQGSKKGASAAV